MNGIYFDQAASSFPKAPGVGDAVARMLETEAVNIGRGNYEASYSLTEKVMDTRSHLLRLFHAPKDCTACFTGGATQALNQFLFGLLKPGDHLITTSVEHNAVMRPLHILEERGVSVTAVSCGSDGTLDPDAIKEAVRPATRAVIMTHASNVCGTILPIEGIGRFCRERGLFFAVDAAQTAGILPIDMDSACIDYLAFPGHKGLRGPQGIGGFIVRNVLAEHLVPLIYGGTGSLSDSEAQPDFLPDKFESGTLPLPAIIGLDTAIRDLTPERMREIRLHEQMLTKQFLNGLASVTAEKGAVLRIAGIADPALCDERVGVVSVDFFPEDNSIAAFELEQRAGILTRVGLHCAPRAHKTLGTFPQGTVRFSFGPENTPEEIETALSAIRELVS